MSKIKAKDFFNRELETSAFMCPEPHIDDVIRFIRDEYGIETNRDELLVEFKRKLEMDKNSMVIGGRNILRIKPTQSLMRKFEKNFPEMII